MRPIDQRIWWLGAVWTKRNFRVSDSFIAKVATWSKSQGQGTLGKLCGFLVRSWVENHMVHRMYFIGFMRDVHHQAFHPLNSLDFFCREKILLRNPLALLDLALKASHDSRFMPIDLLGLWIGPEQGVDGMPHDYIFTVEIYIYIYIWIYHVESCQIMISFCFASTYVF